MIVVIASISVQPGRLAEFLEIFKSNVPSVRNEQGCIEYFPTVDLHASLPPQSIDENLVTIIEKWQSLEALHKHLKAPHMLSYREQVKGMVTNLSLKVLQEA